MQVFLYLKIEGFFFTIVKKKKKEEANGGLVNSLICVHHVMQVKKEILDKLGMSPSPGMN